MCWVGVSRYACRGVAGMIIEFIVIVAGVLKFVVTVDIAEILVFVGPPEAAPRAIPAGVYRPGGALRDPAHA